MNLKTGLMLSSTLTLAALCAPNLALAQAAANAPIAPAVGAPAAVLPSQSPGQPSSTTIGEIIVTAEHRSINVQKSALNITAITGASLTARGVNLATDLQNAVPGFSESHTNSNSYIGLYGLQSGTGTAYTDPSMTFNYGGISLARQTAAQSSFFDLERIEVLKGPQGTLYGRNATVGALNLVLAQPKFDRYGAAMTVTGGNYATVNTTGYVNLPLNDQFAARAAWQTTRHDGFYSNGYGDANNYGERFSLLYKPDDKLSVLVWLDGYQDRSRGPFSTFQYYLSPTQKWINPNNPWQTIGAPGSCSSQILCPSYASTSVGGVNAQASPSAAAGGAAVNGYTDLSANGLGNTALAGTDGYSNIDQYIYATQVDYNLNFATATVVAARVNTLMKFKNYTNGLIFINNTAATQDSVEARLASDGNGPLKWTAGGFYFHERQNALIDNYQSTGVAILNTPDLIDTSYAAFLDSTYSLLSNLRLTGGVRWTREEKNQDGYATSTGVTPAQAAIFTQAEATCYSGTVANKVAFGGFYFPSNFCVVPNAGHDVESNISWKGGIEADIRSNSLVYANVKTGFRDGGFTIGTQNTYKPEHLTAYEIGSKNQFFDRRLQANVSAFYWDYKDEQISQLQQYYVNGVAAGQTSFPFNVNGNLYGAEFTGEAVATSHDRFNADVLWAKGKLDKTPLLTNSAGVTISLTNVPRWDLPEWTMTGGYNHTFDLQNEATLVLAGRVHYASRTILRLIDVASQVPGDFQDAYAKFDFDLTYTEPQARWTIQGYVQNATNLAIVSTGASGQVSAPTYFKPVTNPVSVRSGALEAPRTFGARFTAKF